MKYLSVFITILLIWIAVILMAVSRHNTANVYELYLAVMVCTVALFLIGFSRK